MVLFKAKAFNDHIVYSVFHVKNEDDRTLFLIYKGENGLSYFKEGIWEYVDSVCFEPFTE